MATRHKSRKSKARKRGLAAEVQRGAIKPGLRLARELTGLGTSISSLGALKNRRKKRGPRGSLTYVEAHKLARASGYLHQDTGAYEAWEKRHGLDKRGEPVRKQLRKAFEEGVSEKYNPAASGAQYRLAQAVLSGTARSDMPKSVAQEIVDRTPAKLRSEFMSNPKSMESYIASIRNRDKHAYASAYARWIHEGERGDPPDRGKLSYMAAQAVRLNLREIWDRKHETHQGAFLGLKRNPEESAAAMHEAFTGYPSEYVEEVVTERHVHEWLAGTGDMVLLVVTTPTGKQATIGFNGYDPKTDELTAPDGDRVRFCVNEEGTQIYLEGGDQSVDLEALGFDQVAANRDKVEIGRADRIVYFTRKRFDDGEPINYEHEFNEEERGKLRDAKPVVVYDTLNQAIELWGGRYHVELDEQVDGMSPGLVN